MKKIFYGLILCIIQLNPVFAMDNTIKEGYSSELSNIDRNKIYLAKNFLTYGAGFKKAIELTAPYISDKNNIEARYIYAVSMARYDLKESLDMLKALTDEGYPYAMETYGEKRTCQLNRYKKLCDNSGYKKLLRTMYYDNTKNYLRFSKYLRYPDSKLDPKLKKEYDKAIKLNNNQGWDMEMRSYSIEPYEKLYNDESLSGFFNKVNKLDSE
ncbi:TPA: hypothetical protein ACX6SK_000677 [Photobacterium damselae]